VLFVDIEELASIRKVLGRERQVVTQLGTDIDLFSRKVAGALLEAGQFLCDHIT
jgi:hypothetical protein